MNEDINLVRLGNIYGDQFGTGFGGNVWSTGGGCADPENNGSLQPAVRDNQRQWG